LKGARKGRTGVLQQGGKLRRICIRMRTSGKIALELRRTRYEPDELPDYSAPHRCDVVGIALLATDRCTSFHGRTSRTIYPSSP